MAELKLTWCGGKDFGLVSVKSLREALLSENHRSLEHCPILKGNKIYPLGELFSLRGSVDKASPQVSIETLSASLDDIGYGWSHGRLDVWGDAGDYCGAAMMGGEIVVHGSARHYAAASMVDGKLMIEKNVGDYLGSVVSMPSHKDGIHSMMGMQGGIVRISGNCGNHAALRMRRGLVVIDGAVGDFCASRMLAGTIVIRKTIGKECGRLMMRGTVIAFEKAGNCQSWLAPPFAAGGEQDLIFLGFFKNMLENLGVTMKMSSRCHRWVGDRSIGGKGEILVIAS